MRRSTLAPAIVLAIAVTSGGWFLQQGVDQQQNVYLQLRLFEEVVDHVADRFVREVAKDELFESAIEGVLDRLDDPNTSFIDARQYEDFQIRTQGDYGGVGLEIVERDGLITVVSPIPGTPGARAGIRPGDQFVEIEGEDSRGWEVEQAVNVLRGRPGTDVLVRVRRFGVDQPIAFTLTRASIRLKAVPFAMRLDGDIGYVPLRIFRDESSEEVRQAVDSLRAQGALSGLILDLRNNPGGLLNEGIQVSDLFLPRGAAVVETRGRARGQNEAYDARRPDIFEGLPVVVLVDGSSASASEIVAGALQDHDRALVLGLPTFGKGSVQTVYRLSGNNHLRLTTALWYTPAGRSIQKGAAEDRETPRRGTLTLDGRVVEVPDTGARPAFTSEGGRRLLGGGGIVPDLIVFPDTLSTSEQAAVRTLYREAGAVTTAVFNYAVRYLQSHPGLASTFRLDEEGLGDFVHVLAEHEVEVDRQVVDGAARYLRHQISREISLQAWGEEAEFLQLLESDAQLSRARSVLAGVSSMPELLRAAGSQQSDVDPVGAGADGGD